MTGPAGWSGLPLPPFAAADLDEVRAAVLAHPEVTDCAVTVRRREPRLVARAVLDPASEDATVVAYVTGERPPDIADLRAHLADRLAPHLVPDDVVAVAELPLTSAGTIAYRRLADAAASTGGHRAYVPPVTEDQARVCEVWAQVLGVERVGIHDSFLSAGGDSLQALRIIARLRGSTGKPLTVRDVLLNETPEQLAAVLAARESTSDTVVTDPGGPEPSGHPLSAHQAGVYFQWLMAPESPYYSYQGTLRLHGPLDEPRLRRAWEILLEENPSLLVRFADQDDEPIQKLPYWTVELGATVELAGDSGAEARFAADADAVARRAFDLKGEPLLRTTLYRFAPDEHRLLVTMHEILLDGWGALVLFGRLGDLYATLAGRPDLDADPRRRELFARYLRWQERHHASAEVQAAGRHWEAGLADALPVLDLPTDRPRPAFPSFRGGLIEQVLPPASARAVNQQCAAVGVTPFMLMLGAFALTLTYHAGEQEVVVGAPMANRDTEHQVDVVGFLLNMLPLRVTTEPGHTVGEFLDLVRRTVLDGLAASDYPFAWILRKLNNLPRTLDRAPVIQVMLNMLNYPVQAGRHDGVDFRFVEMDTGFTKFDCALYVQPHGATGLLLQLAYQTDLFDRETAERLLAGVLLAVDALTGDTTRPIGEIDLLPADERQLLDSFTRGA
jgi:hypothetical protein